MLKWLYNLAGILCVVLGVIGAFLPLLPTTPFLLLAAFCFSKGSERLHQWLLHHPTFGPTIIDWQTNRVIRPRAKKTATIMIILVMSPTLIFGTFPILLKIVSATVGAGVVFLIWSYPSRPRVPSANRTD